MQEAYRATNFMVKVILQKVSEVKVSYVLYPFDQETTSRAIKLFKKSKKER